MAEDARNAYDRAYGTGPLPGQSAPGNDASQPQPAAAPAQQGFAQPFSDGAPAPQPAAAPVAAAPRQGKGWIVGIAVIVAIAVVCIFGIASCTSTMSSLMSPWESLSEDGYSYTATEPSVGIIELGGTIQYDGSSCSPEGLKDLLDQAEEDSDIAAVVLRVDSGGGVATAGEEMAQYVKGFDKPIVVSSASTNASAAYEISSQADMIFVDKTTMIGSIGVIMQVTDLSGLYDKLGIGVENITSAESKDAGQGTRPLTEAEREAYQGMVDQINELFIQTVAEGRDMKVEDVRKLATGMPFTGMDAVENGLADEIGLLDDAVAAASELAGHDEPLPTVSLTYSGNDLTDLLDLLGYSESDLGDAAKLQELIDALGAERALG